MADEIIKQDSNFVNVSAGVSNDTDKDILMLRVDSTTKELLVVITNDTATSQSSSPIAKRDQNYKTVCLAYDATNETLQEILTDSSGYLLADVEF